MIKKICPTCKKEFVINLHTQHRNKKFCSRKCIRNKTQFKKDFSPWNKGKKWIEMSAMKMGKNNPHFGKFGELNPNWKGGKSLQDGRKTQEFVKWRMMIFARDNWTCQTCNRAGKRLEAHHIKKWAEYPQLRFDFNNGITLCRNCHKLTDNYANK